MTYELHITNLNENINFVLTLNCVLICETIVKKGEIYHQDSVSNMRNQLLKLKGQKLIIKFRNFEKGDLYVKNLSRYYSNIDHKDLPTIITEH